MFHSRDSPRLLVCDTGLYSEQNDIGFITVAICGGYISKCPGLYRYPTYKWNISLFCRNNVGVLKTCCVKSISGNICVFAFSIIFQYWDGAGTGNSSSWTCLSCISNTVRCRYNVVDFLQNHHKGHPVSRPHGRAMGCLLWVQTYIHILPQLPQWCI